MAQVGIVIREHRHLELGAAWDIHDTTETKTVKQRL